MAFDPEVFSVILRWLLQQGGSSNLEVAILSNVCSAWRQVVHEVLLEQAEETELSECTGPLLLIPSMIRCVLRGDEEKLPSETIANTETFCAAWFRPEGIREKSVALDLSKDAELREIQQQVQQNLLLVSSSGDRGSSLPVETTSRFGPGGEQAFDGSDDDEQQGGRSRRIRRQQNRKSHRSRSPVRHRLVGSNHSVRKTDSPDRVATLDEWKGYQFPMDVLRNFGYKSEFVDNLLQAASRIRQERTASLLAQKEEDIGSSLLPNNVPGRYEPTFAVRGTTVARPEGYCLCMDEDDLSGEKKTITAEEVARLIKSQTSDCDDDDDDDDDDEEIAEIRLQEYRDHLVRREMGRRELQREVLPRVIWSSPPIEKQNRRCVQFLNAGGDHAVCVMTPPFACGPLVEPVTIICVGIATEDGCFLSGLHHRFELGHLYPETEIAEVTERSAICIATEAWSKNSSNEEDSSGNHIQTTAKDSGSEAPLRLSVSEDGSNSYLNPDTSDEEESASWSQENCTCMFRDNGSKVDEMDADVSRRIYRGRFGPGSWHCYTAIFDGEKSEIRVDGVAEPVKAGGKLNGDAKGMLDGLTLGSDHCFAVSLCCGQQPPPGGDGAIAEVAVFQGRLGATDLECIERDLMNEHGIPSGLIGEISPSGQVIPAWKKDELDKKAEALFLWPPPPPPFSSTQSLPSVHGEEEATADGDAAVASRESVPLRYLTRHRMVSWKQYHPVNGEEIRISKIGARNSVSSSDW